MTLAKKVHRATSVFVPGGMPSLTYVDRAGRELEKRLAAVSDNLCKLVTLTGATKSGKTVLTNKVFPRAAGAVWVDGGSIGSEADLWSTILDALGGATNIEKIDEREIDFRGRGDVRAKAGLPLFGEAEIQGEVEAARKRSKGTKTTLAKSPRASALAELRRSKTPLVIDDFHYLDRTLQGSVVRALKPLVFEGLPAICIAIPHRRYDAVKVEREMTGRLEPIDVPAWSVSELAEIPQIGFPLLNVRIDAAVTSQLAEEAQGSPHLMQEFCKRLASHNGIVQTSPHVIEISSVPRDLFGNIAAEMGKVVYDKLKKGPRQRSDRKQRPLLQGGTADTYEAVLRGLSKISPGLDKVDYEQLRAAIRGLLKSDVPQAHEISRVLEKMSEIASNDEASTPVLDWDKDERELHITDPFFAFILKWGELPS